MPVLLTDTIQLTAALAPGDSGGPVINNRGEVLGVVSYIALNNTQDVPQFLRGYLGDEPEFAAYAAPILNGSETLEALMTGAHRDIPVIGFRPEGFDYDPTTSRFDLGARPGVVVSYVQPEGPADLAGLRSLVLREGELESADVIVAIDDEPTTGFYELIELLYEKGVGETVTVTVQRGGDTFKVRLELGGMRDVFN